MPKPVEVQYLTIHGHRRAFIKTGTGPALLLLHGLGCDHTTWLPVVAALSRRYTVIAPDLLGHGRSAKPRADYSVGGYANGMRDLLTVLGIDKVTVVGHSFGGGVAMQFAYQFPERTERMILVVARRSRSRGDPGDPGDHAARLQPGDAGGDAAGPAACGHRRDARPRGDRAAAHPGPRRGGHDLRLVRRQARPRGDPARGERGRRLARPGRDDGRPGLPHPGDADVRDLGHRGRRDPGAARGSRGGAGARGDRRGDRERRPLPAQGPSAAVREARQRLHPYDAAGGLPPGPVASPAQERRPHAARDGRSSRAATA